MTESRNNLTGDFLFAVDTFGVAFAVFCAGRFRYDNPFALLMLFTVDVKDDLIRGEMVAGDNQEAFFMS